MAHVGSHTWFSGDFPARHVWLPEGASSNQWILVTIPSGKHTKNYGKIHHFSSENSQFLWPFSRANCQLLPEGIRQYSHDAIIPYGFRMIPFEFLQPRFFSSHKKGSTTGFFQKNFVDFRGLFHGQFWTKLQHFSVVPKIPIGWLVYIWGFGITPKKAGQWW